jgi:hypothetical protein
MPSSSQLSYSVENSPILKQVTYQTCNPITGTAPSSGSWCYFKYSTTGTVDIISLTTGSTKPYYIVLNAAGGKAGETPSGIYDSSGAGGGGGATYKNTVYASNFPLTISLGDYGSNSTITYNGVNATVYHGENGADGNTGDVDPYGIKEYTSEGTVYYSVYHKASGASGGDGGKGTDGNLLGGGGGNATLGVTEDPRSKTFENIANGTNGTPGSGGDDVATDGQMNDQTAGSCSITFADGQTSTVGKGGTYKNAGNTPYFMIMWEA